MGNIFSTAQIGVTFFGFGPGDRFVVFDSGPLGLLAAYPAILRGRPNGTASNKNKKKLDLAASIGTIPIKFASSDPGEQIMVQESGGVRQSVEAGRYGDKACLKSDRLVHYFPRSVECRRARGKNR